MSTVPPAPGSPAAASYAPPPGPQGSRINRTALIAVFAGVLAGLLIVTFILVKVRGPGRAIGQCVGALCPPPPGPGGLVSLVHWKSAALGYSVGYDSSDWQVLGEDDRSLRLQNTVGDVSMWIEGAPASQVSPQQLFQQRLSALQQNISTISVDNAPEDRILGAHIGFVPAIAATYGGTEQATSQQVWVYVMAAADQNASIVVSAVSAEPDFKNRAAFLGYADGVLNEIIFPSAAA